MSKQVIVIGGGISGLSALHFFHKRFPDNSNLEILLLEKEPQPGGTIRSIRGQGGLFETGPNGFLNNKEETIALIHDLGLDQDVIFANPESKLRYLSIKNKLIAFPRGPGDFFLFPTLSLLEKTRVLFEVFVPRGNDPNESIYEFGKRRFGKKFTEVFLDPFVKGIYAGDIHSLNLNSAFPQLYEWERIYGSLIKGISLSKKNKSDKSQKHQKKSIFSSQLCSFSKGMGQLIDALHKKYSHCILTNQDVKSIKKFKDRFAIETQKETYSAHHVFLCAPAYCSAEFLQPLNSSLAQLLKKIYYAPVIVAGLLYSKSDVKNFPCGFGYLIPSFERKPILGVLVCSNIFQNRATENHVLFRIMLGGTNNPEVINLSQKELIELARNELKTTLDIRMNPKEEFIKIWPKAIPQYDLEYPEVIKNLQKELTPYSGLHIIANYWMGISLNDCIANAKKKIAEIMI